MRLAVSVGCPSGIGPEVAVRAANAWRGRAHLVLVGDVGALRASAKLVGLDPESLVRVDTPDSAARRGVDAVAVWQPTRDLAPRDRVFGKPSPAGGAAQLAWIDAAAGIVREGVASALVTGPVSKRAVVRSRAKGAAEFRGHTEHLERMLGAKAGVTMLFWTRALSTSLVTTHMALADVPSHIERGGVVRATCALAEMLSRTRGRSRRSRIAVAGLNPHAGEDGLLGAEEKREILPGIALAKRQLERSGVRATIDGPLPADTAYRLGKDGAFDGVVAMYHDQATIAFKLLGFGEAVNVSWGLPIVRTSVDHGTAYDRAGKGKADASGMVSALALAEKLARSKA